MEDKKYYSARAFLNKKGYHSNAAVVTSIQKSKYDEDNLYGFFKISDCNKTVELSIDLDTVEEVNNSLYKINKLIELSTKYRDAILAVKPMVSLKEKKEKNAEKLKKDHLNTKPGN